MTTDTDTTIDTIEKEELEEDRLPAQVELAFRAIDMLCEELREKVDIDTMADAFMSVGFDMTRHIAEHALPGKSTDERIEAVRKHLHAIIEGLVETVWKQSSDQESE